MSFTNIDEERPFVSEYKHVSNPKLLPTWREKATTLLLVLNVSIILGAAVSFSRLVVTMDSLKRPERVDGFDDILLSPPIIWESRTFKSHVDERKGTVTDYVIPSSPAMTADWHSLLDVGEITLSEVEAARISQSTARLGGGEDGPTGVVEVFHQLHCLDRIRTKFFNLPGYVDDPGDSELLSHWHDSHCFDYLWQTLLCHADVSFMTIERNDMQQANTSVTKQCRNFEAIHNWAKNRKAKSKPPGHAHPTV